MLFRSEPEHVGALALTGEIFIRRGMYEEAAANLARLSTIEAAPPKNRVTAGIAAVDLYENKLDRYDRALEVLVALHHAKLSSLPVRERLARAAARTGSWKEATAILEELMQERPEAQGRIEAARLALAIHRDRLGDMTRAGRAVVKLLEESPADGEALDILFGLDGVDAETLHSIYSRAIEALLAALKTNPLDVTALKRLARVARAIADSELEHVALATLVLLTGPDPASERAISQFLAKKPRTPQRVMQDEMRAALVAPHDDPPVSRLFQLLGPTLAEALGPSLQSLSIGKRDRVDPKSGLALRGEIATWASTFGIETIDLYIGGTNPMLVQGIPGETPAIVVGSGIHLPLTPPMRARIARELWAIGRGTTVLRTRDEQTIAAIIVAACHLADVRFDAPPSPVLVEIEKLLTKAIARKTKKALPEICRAIVASHQDTLVWRKRALMTLARAALVASGDVAFVVLDTLGEPPERVMTSLKNDDRAAELLRFVMSPTYVDIRRSLGLEERS